ncbi:hypothetical protein [Bacillus weihaiensis]|uniref:Uncharacterized protein n=1 Tax=Bacillus weihaiensis TaxID=1547283 RepID=A0A1L3MND1_9BACI|nr:hypothetical protein [Bacillus weihaiensis]APH03870.1 hypothetical protein A9C19_03330 [Bacillus weihaiensis]
MHVIKFFVAGCIFSSLFGGAWLVNEKLKREYVDTLTYDDSVQITNLSTTLQILEDSAVFEKFKPREYVRVVMR